MADKTRRFELRLSDEDFVRMTQMAEDQGLSAANIVSRLLREEWTRHEQAKVLMNRNRLHSDSRQLLDFMAEQDGVQHAVVFTGPPNSKTQPLPSESNHPMPVYHQGSDFGYGVIVVQGFCFILDDAEKGVVEARFPQHQALWKLTAGFDADAFEALVTAAPAHERALYDAAIGFFDRNRLHGMALEAHQLINLAQGPNATMTATKVLKRLASLGALRERNPGVFESVDAFLEYLDRRIA